MTVRLPQWQGALPRAVLLVVAAALVPMPAVASESASQPKAKSIQTTMRDVVAREVAAMPSRNAAARTAAQGTTDKQSVSFFKTTPGIVALVVLAAGTGYALYSASHDRITSPAKE